jgi:hypothetical protein
MANTIRPVTPKLLLETLRVANHATIDPSLLSRSLWLSSARSHEILRQLQKMGLLKHEVDGHYGTTSRGEALFRAATQKDNSELHRVLMNYEPYAAVYSALEDKPADIRDLVSAAGVNQVAAETLLRLVSWATGRLRKNKTTGGYYVSSTKSPARDTFVRAVGEFFQNATRLQFGIRREYVTIPRLRENICERLRLDPSDFNRIFELVIREHPTFLELSSAPAPVTEGSKEKGVMIAGRHYFYARLLRGMIEHGN